MRLHCTQKLLKAFGLPKDQLAPPPSNRLLGWHAHIISIARSKTIIAINDQNFFAIIIPDIRKERLKNFSNEFHLALSTAFKSEGLEKGHAEILFGDGISFTKTHDRQVIGIINEIVKDIRYRIDYAGGWQVISVLELTESINRTPWLASSRNSVVPIQQMTNDLKRILPLKECNNKCNIHPLPVSLPPQGGGTIKS